MEVTELPSASESDVDECTDDILASAHEDGIARKVIHTNRFQVFVKGCFTYNFDADKWRQYCGFWQDLSDMPEKGERKLNKNMENTLEVLKHDISNAHMDLTLRKRMYWTSCYFWALSGLSETWGSLVAHPSSGAVGSSVDLYRELPGMSSESGSDIDNRLEDILARAHKEGIAPKVIYTNRYQVFVKGCFTENLHEDKWRQYCSFWQSLSEMPERDERKFNESMESTLQVLKSDISNAHMDLTLRKRLYWTSFYFWTLSEFSEAWESLAAHPSPRSILPLQN